MKRWRQKNKQRESYWRSLNQRETLCLRDFRKPLRIGLSRRWMGPAGTKIASSKGLSLVVVSCREFGFSLLEILIAVAILAASFTALLASQGSSFLS
ncbi:MAG: prepilin-type N-terminal cleavage/methylation domain-containing protein, partial [Deltaproteobacteria bacterium]|nr:prepilin-type N-terminal cleavage/methylation domain-containing protein [Deltaproteobacteria bacterium]